MLGLMNESNKHRTVGNAGKICNATPRMYFNKKRDLFPNQIE